MAQIREIVCTNGEELNSSKKILIVEDDAYIMEILVILLEMEGYSVIQVHTAKEGIEFARTELPGLIIMDIGLPGLDGLGATRIIKKDIRTRKIPVIAVTARAMKEDKEKADRAGCDSYISKPFTTKSLKQEVSRLI